MHREKGWRAMEAVLLPDVIHHLSWNAPAATVGAMGLHHMKNRFAVVGILAVLYPLICAAQTKDTVAAVTLEQRGKSLRAALDHRFRQLAAEKVNGFLSGVDAADVASKFIPIGSSFQDAEAVLKDAGLHLRSVKDQDMVCNYFVTIAIAPSNQKETLASIKSLEARYSGSCL
jgi:hypothetical protein